jgi:hypothetical protein
MSETLISDLLPPIFYQPPAEVTPCSKVSAAREAGLSPLASPRAHELGFDRRMGTGEWIRRILLSPFCCRWGSACFLSGSTLPRFVRMSELGARGFPGERLRSWDLWRCSSCRPRKVRRGSSSGWDDNGKVGRYITQQGNQLPAWLCRRAFKASVSACNNPQKLWTHRIPSEFNTP